MIQRSSRRRVQLLTPNPLGDLLWVNVLLLVGATSLWPIYQHAWFLVVVTVALGAGNLIAWLSCSRGWKWWRTVVTVLSTYLVLSLPVAAPTVWGAPSAAGTLWQSVLTAPVTGWKNLLTLDLPLGTYQATLAPTFLLLLAAPVIALTLAWKTPQAWPLAIPATLAVTVVGVAFGSSALRGEVFVGSAHVSGVTQLGIGIVALLVSLGWAVWRSWAQRTASLRITRESATAQLRNRANHAKFGRIGFAAAMLVAASVAGASVAPVMLIGHTRDVLRTSVDPVLLLQREASPLASYREFFSDDVYEDVLFEVSAPAQAGRVRLATLPFYDGITANAASSTFGGQDASTAFHRVPSALTRTSPETMTVEVTIGAYSDVWVPLTGQLHSINFSGKERAALADGFFFNQNTATGVQLAQQGLSQGSRYLLEASPYTATSADVASFTPARAGGSLGVEIVPESLNLWVQAQQITPDGAGLLALIDRLRARGFLSHALMLDEHAPPQWSSDLGGYSFEPSRAGHSTDRINRLFTDLLDREAEIGADAADRLLVAAVGDDEQFAMAAALIADQLGFDARVVVGAKLTADAVSGITACEAGVCMGKNMSAWVEVRDSATGMWAPIDVTPQHQHAPSPEVIQRSDPLNRTDVEPEQPKIVPPPDANPSDATDQEDQEDEQRIDVTGLLAVLRIIGIVLGVLLCIAAPFLMIIFAKTMRRNSRKQAADPRQQMVGGWDEYVDAAIDYGKPFPTTHTRREIAKLYGTKGSEIMHLAAEADRAAFSAEPVTQDQTRQLWLQLDNELSQLRKHSTRWQRFRSSVSLRSLRYELHRLKNTAIAVEQRPKRSKKSDAKHQTTRAPAEVHGGEGTNE